MLEPILQQVGAGNPQLAQLIGANPDQFLQLLAEDTDGDTPLPPGMQEIQVTEEERGAIERVCSLNFFTPRISSSLSLWNETRGPESGGRARFEGKLTNWCIVMPLRLRPRQRHPSIFCM